MITLYRAILVAGFMATASFADIDSQRMQRDIRIMEGVLANENLYYDVPDGASFRARGLYLDGYGVLFVAAGPASGTERWDKKLSQAELLAATRDLLAEFLGNYAGTISQLDKDDRITVCYQPTSSGVVRRRQDLADTTFFDLTKQVEAIPELREERFDFKELVVMRGDAKRRTHYFIIDDEQIATTAEALAFLEELAAENENQDYDYKSIAEAVREAMSEADSPVKVHVRGHTFRPAADAASVIAATAKKSAIDAFRTGRIDSTTFRQRIVFPEHEDLKKIDIMAGILDQVLEQAHGHLSWPRIQRTLGMYQPDVGALFFIRAPLYFPKPLPLALDDDIKANIVEAVADYGATLGQVQSDENVIVEYRLGRPYLLQVPKSAIEAYARGDLDLDAFRKKAVWKWVK